MWDLATVLEKPGLLIPWDPVDDDPDPLEPSSSSRRPADVWVPRGPSGGQEAWDFSTASALRLGSPLPDPSALASFFASVESRKYSFLNTLELAFRSAPLVLEAVGGGWSDSLRSGVSWIASESKRTNPIGGSDALKRAPEQSGSQCRFLGMSWLSQNSRNLLVRCPRCVSSYQLFFNLSRGYLSFSLDVLGDCLRYPAAPSRARLPAHRLVSELPFPVGLQVFLLCASDGLLLLLYPLAVSPGLFFVSTRCVAVACWSASPAFSLRIFLVVGFPLWSTACCPSSCSRYDYCFGTDHALGFRVSRLNGVFRWTSACGLGRYFVPAAWTHFVRVSGISSPPCRLHSFACNSYS